MVISLHNMDSDIRMLKTLKRVVVICFVQVLLVGCYKKLPLYVIPQGEPSSLAILKAKKVGDHTFFKGNNRYVHIYSIDNKKIKNDSSTSPRHYTLTPGLHQIKYGFFHGASFKYHDEINSYWFEAGRVYQAEFALSRCKNPKKTCVSIWIEDAETGEKLLPYKNEKADLKGG
jgi:hypothetical protein